MGAWGSGNFENDAALDMVGDVLDVATGEITAFCSSDRAGLEDLDCVLASVEVHLALFEKCRAGRPDAATAGALREKVLRIYDEQIDDLEPEDDYKTDRRAVLEATLTRYLREAQQDAAAHE